MNLEFVMATEKPDGTTLEEAGVERIEWDEVPMSCEQFMDGKDKNQAKKYAEMLWNPKVYINIFVYPFSENNTFTLLFIIISVRWFKQWKLFLKP